MKRIVLSKVMMCALLTNVMACAKTNGNTNDDLNLPVASHNSKECLIVTGEFTKAGEGATKILRSQKTDRGLDFEDTGVKWSVDGNLHKSEEDPSISYQGFCEQYSLVFDVFQESDRIMRFSYRFNEKAQLIIETTILDPQLGESELEVWDLKK